MIERSTPAGHVLDALDQRTYYRCAERRRHAPHRRHRPGPLGGWDEWCTGDGEQQYARCGPCWNNGRSERYVSPAAHRAACLDPDCRCPCRWSRG